MKIEMYQKNWVEESAILEQAVNMEGYFVADSNYPNKEHGKAKWAANNTASLAMYTVPDEPAKYVITFVHATPAVAGMGSGDIILCDSSDQIIQIIRTSSPYHMNISVPMGVTRIYVNTNGVNGYRNITCIRTWTTYHVPENPVRTIDTLISAQIRDGIDNSLTFEASLYGDDAVEVNDDTLFHWEKYWFQTTGYTKRIEGRTILCDVTAENILNELAGILVNYGGSKSYTLGEIATQLLTRISPQFYATASSDPIFTRKWYLRYWEAVPAKQLLEDMLLKVGAEIEYNGFEIQLVPHRGTTERYDMVNKLYVDSVEISRDVVGQQTSYSVNILRRTGDYECILGEYTLGSVPVRTMVNVGDEVKLKVEGFCNIDTRITGITFNPYDPDGEVSIDVGSKTETIEQQMVNNAYVYRGGIEE